MILITLSTTSAVVQMVEDPRKTLLIPHTNLLPALSSLKIIPDPEKDIDTYLRRRAP